MVSGLGNFVYTLVEDTKSTFLGHMLLSGSLGSTWPYEFQLRSCVPERTTEQRALRFLQLLVIVGYHFTFSRVLYT